MKKYLFLLVGFSFLMAGCGKIEVAAPQHVNKFTCKVNGVFWEALPKQRDILGNDLQLDKSPFFDFGYLYASNKKSNQSISISFFLNDTVKVNSIRDKYPFSDYGRKCEGYNLDTLSRRTVVVTEHDKVKKIIKGTFTFRAINVDVGCVDTATVTEGFFDVQYSE
jgi:hypothetical protein